jgi:hypothetical protein
MIATSVQARGYLSILNTWLEDSVSKSNCGSPQIALELREADCHKALSYVDVPLSHKVRSQNSSFHDYHSRAYRHLYGAGAGRRFPLM